VRKIFATLFTICLTLIGIQASQATSASPINQYAVDATASTYYSDAYGPAKATGAPDNSGKCEDSDIAWASLSGKLDGETITLTYATAVVPSQIKIWMNVEPKSLVKVEARKGDGAWTNVLSRKITDSLKTSASCATEPFTPHTLTASNSTMPNTDIDQIRLTFNEAQVYENPNMGMKWSAELDAVQLTGLAPAKPAATKAASISGSSKVGSKLTASPGTWSGAPKPTYTYTWAACTKSGAAASSLPRDCTVISKATASSLTLASAQRGKFIRVIVSAKNSLGTVTSVSAATSKVG